MARDRSHKEVMGLLCPRLCLKKCQHTTNSGDRPGLSDSTSYEGQTHSGTGQELKETRNSLSTKNGYGSGFGRLRWIHPWVKSQEVA